MKISGWYWKNFKSYGNIEQKIEFLPDKGELILLNGFNGGGKCVDKKTIIECQFHSLYDVNYSKIEYFQTYVGQLIYLNSLSNTNILNKKSIKITIGDLFELGKYLSIVNSNILIDTPKGFKKLLGVNITAKDSKVMKITTKDNLSLLCAPDHLVKMFDNTFIKVQDFLNLDVLERPQTIITKRGFSEITSCELLDYTDDLLDVFVDGNEYYSNNILSHNSSCLTSLDFALYGECLNSKGKRLSQKLIPNRTNGDVWTNVKFSNTDYTIDLTRSISGSLKTTLIENGQPYTKAGKVNSRIEEIIGFDFETFKSFISLNVTIFKDFINLTPDDKRTILDKLFNLEIINELNKVLKTLQKQNESNYQSISREVSIYEDQIENLKQSIDDAVNQITIDNNDKITNLKEELNKYKDTFVELEEKKDSLNTELNSIKTELTKLNNQRSELNRDLKDIQKQLDLFNSGKCPTCQSDLSIKLDIKSDLNTRFNLTTKLIEELNNTIIITNEDIEILNTKVSKATQKWTDLMIMLGGIKTQIKNLKQEQEENSSDGNNQTKIFKDNLLKNEEKLKNKQNESLESLKLKMIYDTLNPIWGESGVKRDMIEEIIEPINFYLQEDLSILGSRFKVEIDNNFDAHILEWGTEIDPDTLSTGEGKRINLVIMLAYIKMIRLKKDINILILDELFASIDIEGVDFILQLMKKYANERGINIIVVHHSELNKSLFDRIITVHKTHYSYLEDVRVND
jgi:DNA repair exonuclease SbcCD ATPase subunit